MAVFNSIPLKNLRQINSVNENDFLIIDTKSGINLVKLPFFILKDNNVSFYTSFETISTAAISLNASTNTQLPTLSSDIRNYIVGYTNSFSATVDNFYDRIFVAKGQLTIPSQSTRSNVITINTSNVTLSVFDVVLTFNSRAPLINTVATWATAISGDMVVFSVLSAKSPFVYDIQARTTNGSLSAISINYRIIKPY